MGPQAHTFFPANTRIQHAPAPQPCGDIKPRLTKEQHEYLEAEFQKHHKPSTVIKNDYAEQLRVPREKINNWFQNRRAKVKQDLKKSAANGSNASAVGHGQKQNASMDHSLYRLGQSQFSASTPNLNRSPPKADTKGLYSSGRLATSQVNVNQDYNLPLQSISETSNQVTPDYLMDCFAGAGYDFPHPPNDRFSATQEPMFGLEFGDNVNALPNTFVDMGPAFAALENSTVTYSNCHGNDSTLDTSSYANSASTSAQNLAVYANPDATMLSANPSVTPQGASGPSPMPTLNTNFAGLVENNHSSATVGSNSQFDGSVEGSMSNLHSLDSASPQSVPVFSAGEHNNLTGSQNFYVQRDHSSVPLLAASGLDDDMNTFPFADAAFARRSSSTSVFAESVASDSIPVQGHHTPNPRRSGQFPSSIANRRQRPHPTALGPAAMRSSSHPRVPASPGSLALGPDQRLRRVQSGGVTAPRVQKSGTGSAPRSPLAMSFSDASAAYIASTMPGAAAHGSTLAPPTPMSPSGMSYTHLFGDGIPTAQQYGLDQSLSTDVLWPSDFGSLQSHSAESPPYTPMDKLRMSQPHSRVNSIAPAETPLQPAQAFDAPPQSAPATQQAFAGPAFLQYPSCAEATQLPTGFGNNLLPHRQHGRSPSMPVSTVGASMDHSMAYTGPAATDGMCMYSTMPKPPHMRGLSEVNNQMNAITMSEANLAANLVNGAPVPDLEFNMYQPPQDAAPVPTPHRSPDAQPKSYTFQNQSVDDFKSSS